MISPTIEFEDIGPIILQNLRPSLHYLVQEPALRAVAEATKAPAEIAQGLWRDRPQRQTLLAKLRYCPSREFLSGESKPRTCPNNLAHNAEVQGNINFQLLHILHNANSFSGML